MIIILKKGVAIFHRLNTPDYMFLRRRKLWELSHFKNIILTLIFTELQMTVIAL